LSWHKYLPSEQARSGRIVFTQRVQAESGTVTVLTSPGKA